jgi:hypothetical protein
MAVARARKFWRRDSRIRWIVADTTQLAWPEDFFGLVCAFGFTDQPFFARVRELIVPGGLFLYEGFSSRQLEVKPELDPAWTSTAAGMGSLFAGWEILTCEEVEGPPFRLRFAAIRPTKGRRE